MFDRYTEEPPLGVAIAIEAAAHIGLRYFEAEQDIPLRLHPAYVRVQGYRTGHFANAEDAFARCLASPIYATLRDEVGRTIRTVRRVLSTYERTVMAVA